MKTSRELIDLLDLEYIEENIFRGNNYQAPWQRVFGGQVLAQALHAAYQTVPEDRFVHSLHGYFILAGSIDIPIVFEVDRIRDGRSFTTRRVVAIQRGKAIFNLSASFQLKQEGLDHQIQMPNVPPPGALLPDHKLVEHLKESNPKLYKRYSTSRPIEFRPIEKHDPLRLKNSQPFKHVWMKAEGNLPTNQRVHDEILAYTSDYNLLGTSTLPHQGNMNGKRFIMASLDHAMWFHREFRMDEWLLYAIDSPSASNSRGFNRGNIFDQQGRLVASVVQEGMMRVKDEEQG